MIENDFISRSALKAEAIEMEIFQPYGGDGSCMGVTVGTIDCVPTVDAEPVRHGQWIDMQEDDATEGMWRCSACGFDGYFDIMTPRECGTNYCPNCGAKMDAEVEG